MDYSPFIKFMKSQSFESINCTFDQIEKILGNSMPSSAYKYPAWWANSPSQSTNGKKCLELDGCQKN